MQCQSPHVSVDFSSRTFFFVFKMPKPPNLPTPCWRLHRFSPVLQTSAGTLKESHLGQRDAQCRQILGADQPPVVSHRVSLPTSVSPQAGISTCTLLPCGLRGRDKRKSLWSLMMAAPQATYAQTKQTCKQSPAKKDVLGAVHAWKWLKLDRALQLKVAWSRLKRSGYLFAPLALQARNSKWNIVVWHWTTHECQVCTSKKRLQKCWRSPKEKTWRSVIKHRQFCLTKYAVQATTDAWTGKQMTGQWCMCGNP